MKISINYMMLWKNEGFNFEKYGIKKFIPTPTSIIASANPANKDSWINNEKIDFNELPFLSSS